MSNDFRTKPIGTGHHRPLFLTLFIFQNIYRLCSLLLTTFHGQTFYYVFFQRPGTFQLHSQLHNYSLITKQSSNLINHFFAFTLQVFSSSFFEANNWYRKSKTFFTPIFVQLLFICFYLKFTIFFLGWKNSSFHLRLCVLKKE